MCSGRRESEPESEGYPQCARDGAKVSTKGGLPSMCSGRRPLHTLEHRCYHKWMACARDGALSIH